MFLVQSVLLFSLGFLSAAFLALMVAPAIWGRAVALTKKRIEASVPLTMNEVQADKDQLRAEFAMSTRRLEVSVKQFKEKISHQMLELSRTREELVRLTNERDGKQQAISTLEAQGSTLRAELKAQEEALSKVSLAQTEAQAALDKRVHELERVNLQLQEASEIADSRKIELVARDTEIGALTDKLGEHRREQKDQRHYSREVEIENKALQESLRQERKRHADGDKKIERLTAQVSDREEKLERREKEFARLREQMKLATLDGHDVDKRLVAADRVRLGLEAEVGELTARLASLLGNARGGDIELAFRKLEDDREKLKQRVGELTRANKALEEKQAQGQLAISQDWQGERRDTAVLREQINDIAAEMVRMTAALEGPDSPINTALKTEGGRPALAAANRDPDTPISLADRVRALQKAASAK
jgi:chromosome segregation ATPase